LGIQRFRFYIKCSDCARPITFLTDPKNTDYEMESGGTRNYEVWHDETKVNAENERSVEEEEKLDSMKALENRVAESQREMAEMDALEEIRAMNERHSRLMKGGRKVDVAEAVLKAREVAMGGGGGEKSGDVAEELLDLNENGLTKDEEDLVQSIKFGVVGASSTDAAAVEIHRLDEHDELLAEKRRQEEAEAIMNKQKQRDEEDKKASNVTVPVFKVKRKKKKISSSDTVTNSTIPEAKRAKVQEVEKKAEVNPPPAESAGLSGLLGGYGSDSDSD